MTDSLNSPDTDGVSEVALNDERELTDAELDAHLASVPNFPTLPAPFNSEAYELLANSVCHDPKDLDPNGESNLLKWAFIMSLHSTPTTLLMPFNPHDETVLTTPIGLKYGFNITYLRTRFFEEAIKNGIGNDILNHAMYVMNLAQCAKFRNKLHLEETAKNRLRGH
jgi:hypothetical protein